MSLIQEVRSKVSDITNVHKRHEPELDMLVAKAKLKGILNTITLAARRNLLGYPNRSRHTMKDDKLEKIFRLMIYSVPKPQSKEFLPVKPRFFFGF